MISTFPPEILPQKGFTQVPTPEVIAQLLQSALRYKNDPFQDQKLGKNKTLVLLFLNPSLRTRLSSQKAAINLGMSVIDLNASEGWKMEYSDQVVMDGDKAEHIREAARVISQYGDIIGIRSFPSLSDKEKDYSDFVINKFKAFASVPVISLESAIRHPLQSLADLITIEEHKRSKRPKVVLTWAPHPKALPQAVANSFVEWMQQSEVDLTIANPEGYDLAPEFVKDTPVCHDQVAALQEADFVYAKNWSCYADYGQVKRVEKNWMITPKKMVNTNNAYFMHCLPVRRNVVVSDQVIDSPQSLVIQQSENRIYAAQSVLSQFLKTI